ncbi:MAG: dihydrofolate reductase family protein [Cyanobacteria bacterium HKST-UBA02]|nr:dihydrofolate reductase family protein [Cyanobacteria bacterium HKST-UBA02]
MKVIFYPAISLDGNIATPDGDSDWVTEEDEELFAEEVRKAGCVIVGSRTYEQYRDIIYPLEGATTFVCTGRKNQEDGRDGVIFTGGDCRAVLEEIASRGFQSVVLSGGGETSGRFAEAGLIDEMLISIYPRFTGEGIGLFGSRKVDLRLQLLGTRELKEGVIRHHYRVCS